VLKQFFFGDHTATVLEEVDEHSKNFWFNSYLSAGTAQLAALYIEFVVAEAVHHRRYP
jgi:hypothetical protein